MCLRLGLAAFVAAIAAFALALPAAAVAAEQPLNIEIKGEGEGVVSCKVGGGPIEECEPEYPSGTQLTLFAEAEEESVFGGWGGACSGTGLTCPLTMSAPRSVIATFNVEQFKLKVKTTGSTGTGSVTGEGIDCSTGGSPGTCAGEYPVGTELLLFAEADEEDSEFVEWPEGCEETEEEDQYRSYCELTLEEDTTVRAVFNLQPLLNIETKGSGTGSVECEFEIPGREECKERYPMESELILYAEAENESAFAGWSGACAGTEECELTMEGPRNVIATFNSTAEYTLTIEGTGPGTVTSSPGSIHCPSTCTGRYRFGTKVTLTASAAAGSLFDGWAGGGCKGIGVCTVTIGSDTTVAAEFEPRPPPDKEEEELEVEAGTARIVGAAKVKGGKAELKLSCSGGPCAGTLQLTAKIKQGRKTKSLTIGKAPFSLAAKASKTIEVKLSGPAKQELAKGKTVKAKVGGSGVAATTISLRAHRSVTRS